MILFIGTEERGYFVEDTAHSEVDFSPELFAYYHRRRNADKRLGNKWAAFQAHYVRCPLPPHFLNLWIQ